MDPRYAMNAFGNAFLQRRFHHEIAFQFSGCQEEVWRTGTSTRQHCAPSIGGTNDLGSSLLPPPMMRIERLEHADQQKVNCLPSTSQRDTKGDIARHTAGAFYGNIVGTTSRGDIASSNLDCGGRPHHCSGVGRRQRRKIVESEKYKEEQIQSSKACKKAKLTREFANIRAEIRGAFVIQRKRSELDLTGLYLIAIPEDYFRIHHGLVAVQDKTSKEIVLIVKFNPFDKMKEEIFHKFEELTTGLVSLKHGASSIQCNSTLRIGQMLALGWRAGTDKGFSFGRYVPNRKMQQDALSIRKWEHEQNFVSWISSLYGSKFSALAPIIFESTKIEIADVEVPTLSQQEFNRSLEDGTGFCSNLTYTVKDFSNAFHKDLDYNSYTYGIWSPIVEDSGKLATQKCGFKSIRGEFLLGSYKVYVDFNSCDGIVEVLWRGKIDFHSTISSSTHSGYTRIGSSVQVNEGLVHQMRKLVKMAANEGVPITNRVRGVQQIVQSKLNNLK